jgi:hypothetical protein
MIEEKKINLPQFGRDIISFKNIPPKLDSINLTLAGWYANYSEKMIQLELLEASFWEKTKGLEKEKQLSDSMVRALWKITPDGNKMIEYERTLKTIEKLMSSLRTSLARADREYRTQK